MKIKQIYTAIAIILFSAITVIGLAHHDSAVAAEDGNTKIETSLLDQVATNGSADFIMQFAQQADLSAAYSMDWDERGNYVYDTLKETANRNQANAKALLDMQGLTYQTFIAGNELYVWGGNQATTNGMMVLNELAALPEVSAIRAPRTYSIDPISIVNPLKEVAWAGDFLAKNLLTTVRNSAIASIAWGIIDTKANQFWADYNHRGEGIVVANIDTGVQWNHPALDQSFKCGSNPSDPACWFDPGNICGGSACDNQGHGTHTMGTMVGDDDPSLQYIVGMAPDAKWIACKGCESNQCSDYALSSCGDWILAPAGNPANRPNVVNNSWGDEGGGGNPWYEAKVIAWRAAGIFPAFSAGNTGINGCSTLGSPGDYQESFDSAAHDSSRNIGNFSSRGPSIIFGHTPYTKPNLSAPGVGIVSSYLTSITPWAWIDGTSMASPHTAGAVALLWSCNPSLKGQVNATFQLLQNTADTPPAGNCGAPADGQGNNTFGYGYLDVLAAGAAACGAAQATWTQLALPAGCPDWTRYDGEYFTPTGKVYFMGGRDGSAGADTYGDIFSFDPATSTCADTFADLSVPISNYTIARINNGVADLLCTFGGRGMMGNYVPDVQCYNPITNNVSKVTDLPVELSSYMASGVAVVNNKVYVFGGFRNTALPYHTAQTWEWDPVGNSWAQKGDLTLGRAYMDTAVVDGKVYAFGGDIFDGTNLVAQTKAEVFTPASGMWDDASVADLPTATGEGVAYGFDSNSSYELAGKVVIAGGGQWPNETGEILQYNVATNSYSDPLVNLSVSRANQAGFFVQGSPGRMWVIGGRSKEAGYGDSIPPYAPPEYINVNLLQPNTITPTSLNTTIVQGQSRSYIVTINNPGSTDLIWSLTESTSAKILNNSTPFEPVTIVGGAVNDQITTKSPGRIPGKVNSTSATGAVLWDQPLSNVDQSAYVDQNFTDDPTYSSFLADDFVADTLWSIGGIFVPGDGWTGFTTLAAADSLTWQIYADNTGFPAGDPSGGGTAPVWTLTLPPTDTQVILSAGIPGGYESSVKLELSVPVVLPAGHYWLVFYPSMPYASGQFGRQPADTMNGYTAKFINPGNGFGYGTAWQDWNILGPAPAIKDIAFRLEGEVNIPWLSENPTQGTLPAGSSQQVTVMIDTIGMGTGVYKAGIFIHTNIPDVPLVVIPVELRISDGKTYLPVMLN